MFMVSNVSVAVDPLSYQLLIDSPGKECKYGLFWVTNRGSNTLQCPILPNTGACLKLEMTMTVSKVKMAVL